MALNFEVRYGDSAKPVDWRAYKDEDTDDDEPLKKTPTSVVEMLGFDPLDLDDEKSTATDALPDNLVYGPFNFKPDADAWAIKLRRKGFFPRVHEWGRLPTPAEEAQGCWIGDPRLSNGWGVFVRDAFDVAKARLAMKTPPGKAKDSDGASSGNGATEAIQEVWGLRTRVETPLGMTRSGVTGDGKAWSVAMPAHYGFIEGVEGADGDSLDCYIGPDPGAGNVYVVDQHNLNGTGFDEHKCLIGFSNQDEALETYMLGHHLSRKTFAAITAFTIDEFKTWCKEHDMSTPCSSHVRANDEEAKFEESKHPRAANGQFGSGGTSAAPSMPKGMEHVTKGQHKTVASFATSLLAEGKYSDADIAKASQVAFGGKTSAASITWYKAQAKKKTPEGQKAAAAKQQGIKANDGKIAEAAKSPMPAAKMDAALTSAEKAGYKTVYISGSKGGKKVFIKLAGVPDGLDKQEYINEALSSKGITTQIVSKWDSSKPAPPDLQEMSLSTETAEALKEKAYAKAAKEQKAKQPVTETTEELSPAMQNAIKHYTNGSYAELNGNLRKGQPLKPEQATIAADLDKAIKSAKLTEDTTLYRKMSNPLAFLGPNPKVGSVLIDNGFISTSKKAGVWSGDVQLTIKCKKGASALDVQSLSLHGSEAEVMLPRGSLFKIKSLTGTKLEVEYLG